jgi:hypothetical protein
MFLFFPIKLDIISIVRPVEDSCRALWKESNLMIFDYDHSLYGWLNNQNIFWFACQGDMHGFYNGTGPRSTLMKSYLLTISEKQIN